MQQPDVESSSPGGTSAPTSTLTPDRGPGVTYGKAFAARLREQGISGAAILRPLVDDLNALAALSPVDKATAARVACNAQDAPNWGAGPVVVMPNGDLIVTSRMVAKEAPVLIVKPNGVVLRGTAGIDMLDETSYVVSNVIEGTWPASATWISSHRLDRGRMLRASTGPDARRRRGARDSAAGPMR
jgi:hypothetical protein